MKRYRLVFSGSGGQGVITAAIILAEAAVMHDKLNAVQSQSYGAAARGGATRSDVIISDESIDFPKVIQPNALICLTQEAYNKFNHIIRPGGLLITDTRFVETSRKVDAVQVQVPIYQSVMEKIGKPIVLNICMLGVVIELTRIVNPESVTKILEQKVPAGLLEINRKALKLGITLARSDNAGAMI